MKTPENEWINPWKSMKINEWMKTNENQHPEDQAAEPCGSKPLCLMGNWINRSTLTSHPLHSQCKVTHSNSWFVVSRRLIGVHQPNHCTVSTVDNQQCVKPREAIELITISHERDNKKATNFDELCINKKVQLDHLTADGWRVAGVGLIQLTSDKVQ